MMNLKLLAVVTPPSIYHIEKNEPQTDIMMKPLAKPQFEYLRKQIMGWWI